MDPQELRQQELPPDDPEFDRNFQPKGAVAFFVLLIILGIAIWYGIYFLMLSHT